MNTKTNVWLRGLVSAFVTSLSTAVLSSFGVTGANAAGIEVSQLDWRQLCAVATAGGIVGVLAFLKQSPIPPAE